MDEFQDNFSEWKNCYKKIHYVWFHFYKILENTNPSTKKESRGVAYQRMRRWWWGEVRQKDKEGQERGFKESTKMFGHVEYAYFLILYIFQKL